MSTVNIHVSNSDVVMLKVHVLLATAEFELIYTSIYVCTVQWNLGLSKEMHVMATIHQSVFGDMNVKVSTWQQHQPRPKIA